MSELNGELRVPIESDADIVTARQKGRALAMEIGFTGSDPTLIAAAISEVARNILTHAGHGEITMYRISQNGKLSIEVVAHDEGPGIADIEQAMQYGYSSKSGIGVGLPGAKLLMDDFGISSQIGKGTRVTMRKWVH